MEGFGITHSLTILTRSSQTKEPQSSHESSLERRPSLLSTEENMPTEATNPVPSTRRDSFFRRSPMPSLPSTPPPDEEASSQIHLISGVGELFPLTLPSRESSLTLGSECASNASLTTPTHHSDSEDGDADDEDLLETPKAEEKHRFPAAIETPLRPIPARDCIVVQMPPLTPSPSPRRMKRGSSPPSTPRPHKRPRLVTPNAPAGSRSSFGQAKPHTTELGGASFLNQRWRWLNDAEMSPLEFGEAAMIKSNGFARRAKSLPDLGSSALDESNRTPSPAPQIQDLSHEDQLQIRIEWFTEGEIEAQLSNLLASYRGFYLDSEVSGNDKGTRYDAGDARAARLTFKAIFENRLNSAEDEGVLLQEEEEDVMNLFMMWVREMQVPDCEKIENFPNVEVCLDRLDELAAAPGSGDMDAARPFLRRIVLSLNPGAQSILGEAPEIRGLGWPTRRPGGALVWEFERLSCDLERSEAAELLIDRDHCSVDFSVVVDE
ncbi:hypothetical protein OQA88_1676 [Cercophora sp. LCS_1]